MNPNSNTRRPNSSQRSNSTSDTNTKPSSKPKNATVLPQPLPSSNQISTSITPNTPSSILTEEDLLKGEDMLSLAKCFDLKEAEQYFKAKYQAIEQQPTRYETVRVIHAPKYNSFDFMGYISQKLQ